MSWISSLANPVNGFGSTATQSGTMTRRSSLPFALGFSLTTATVSSFGKTSKQTRAARRPLTRTLGGFDPRSRRCLARRRQTSRLSLNSNDDLWQDSGASGRSEEHTSELQSQSNIVCRLLLEKK